MKRYLDMASVAVLGLLAFWLSFEWQSHGAAFLQAMVDSQGQRPFVYRILIPYLARLLASWTGWNAVACMLFLFLLSAAGLYFSTNYLYSAFEKDDLRTRVISLVSCILFAGLIYREVKVYDFTTGIFFTLSLGFLARKKYLAYLALFPVATLNRETTFLLLPCFVVAVYQATRVSRLLIYGTAYQVIIYAGIRWMVMTQFANNPGAAFIWRLPQNLSDYARAPLLTLILVGTLGMAVYLVYQGWDDKPIFLRTMLILLFPAQVFLYLLFGMPWELRVYAESFPVLVLLALWPVALWISRRSPEPKPESIR